MQPDELRTAFSRLDGKRTVRITFAAGQTLVVDGAVLIPVEDDGLLKLTDGDREFVVNSARVAWIEIDLPKKP